MSLRIAKAKLKQTLTRNSLPSLFHPDCIRDKVEKGAQVLQSLISGDLEANSIHPESGCEHPFGPPSNCEPNRQFYTWCGVLPQLGLM
jgi:hypothetical protein